MSSGKKKNMKDNGLNRSGSDGTERSNAMEVTAAAPSAAAAAAASASEANTGSASPVGQVFASSSDCEMDNVSQMMTICTQKYNSMKTERDEAKKMIRAVRADAEAARRMHAAELQKKQKEIDQLNQEVRKLRSQTANTSAVHLQQLNDSANGSSTMQRSTANSNTQTVESVIGSVLPHSADGMILIDRTVLTNLSRNVSQQANTLTALLENASVTNEMLMAEFSNAGAAAAASAASSSYNIRQELESSAIPSSPLRTPQGKSHQSSERRRKVPEQTGETSADAAARSSEKTGESPSKRSRLEASSGAVTTGLPTDASFSAAPVSEPNSKKPVVATSELSEVNNSMPPPEPRTNSQKKKHTKKETEKSPFTARSTFSVPASSADIPMEDDFLDFGEASGASNDQPSFLEPESKSDDSQNANNANEFNAADKENDAAQAASRENRQEKPAKSRKNHKASGTKPQQTPERIPPTQSELSLTQSQQSISTSAQTQPQVPHSPANIASLSIGGGARALRSIPSIPAARSPRLIRAAAAKIGSLKEPQVDNDGNWLDPKARKKEEELSRQPEEGGSNETRPLMQKKRTSKNRQADSEDPADNQNHGGAAGTPSSNVPLPPSRSSSYGSQRGSSKNEERKYAH